MHEAAIAQSMFEIISEQARKYNAKPVKARITCGTFHTVNDELLSEAYQAIARDTQCAGTEFEIEHKPILAKCRKCDRKFEFHLDNPACTECSSDDFELLPDEPLILEEIEFQTE